MIPRSSVHEMTNFIRNSILMATLRNGGHSETSARLLVVNALHGMSDGFTATEVCEAVPEVGRATVFRTLRLLVDLGGLSKVAPIVGAPRYTISTNEYHHHIMCVECSKVDNFQDSTIEQLVHSLESEIAGQIEGHRFEIYTICGAC